MECELSQKYVFAKVLFPSASTDHHHKKRGELVRWQSLRFEYERCGRQMSRWRVHKGEASIAITNETWVFDGASSSY